MKTQTKENVTIKAVHDTDLKSLLKRLGMMEDMKNGKIKCSLCDCILKFDNFGGIYKENNQLKPFCQKIECYLEVLKRKNKVK